MCGRILTSASPRLPLFEGEVHHRDSLGSSLAIRPGEVNLMRAGRGIVHSERETSETNLVTGGHGLAHVKGEATEAATRRLFGIQAWAALPRSHEEGPPAFAHHGTAELPRISGEGKTVRLVLGSAYGARSLVEVSPQIAVCRSRAGARGCASARS